MGLATLVLMFGLWFVFTSYSSNKISRWGSASLIFVLVLSQRLFIDFILRLRHRKSIVTDKFK